MRERPGVPGVGKDSRVIVVVAVAGERLQRQREFQKNQGCYPAPVWTAPPLLTREGLNSFY